MINFDFDDPKLNDFSQNDYVLDDAIITDVIPLTQMHESGKTHFTVSGDEECFLSRDVTEKVEDFSLLRVEDFTLHYISGSIRSALNIIKKSLTDHQKQELCLLNAIAFHQKTKNAFCFANYETIKKTYLSYSSSFCTSAKLGATKFTDILKRLYAKNLIININAAKVKARRCLTVCLHSIAEHYPTIANLTIHRASERTESINTIKLDMAKAKEQANELKEAALLEDKTVDKVVDNLIKTKNISLLAKITGNVRKLVVLMKRTNKNSNLEDNQKNKNGCIRGKRSSEEEIKRKKDLINKTQQKNVFDFSIFGKDADLAKQLQQRAASKQANNQDLNNLAVLHSMHGVLLSPKFIKFLAFQAKQNMTKNDFERQQGEIFLSAFC